MSADTQRAITGQDLLANFPGEPSRNPERSYRLPGMGMRRWEVPHRKVKELLALDMLASALRQMLFANWERQSGFASTAATLSNEVASASLAQLDKVLESYAHVRVSAGEWTREVREEIRSLLAGMLRQGGADLHQCEANVRSSVRAPVPGQGAPALFQTARRNQPVQIEEAIAKIDVALTAMWLDGASPVALAHVFQLLDRLNSTLRGKLEEGVQHGAAHSHLEKVCAARHSEWSKITVLSSAAGKRSALLRAHTGDLAARCAVNLQERCEELDESFLKAVLLKLNVLKGGYMAASEYLQNLLEETEREIRDIETDLQAMHSGDGSNKYEFDAAALAKFRPLMMADEHQHDGALALRIKLSEQLHGRSLSVAQRGGTTRLRPTSERTDAPRGHGAGDGDSRDA